MCVHKQLAQGGLVCLVAAIAVALAVPALAAGPPSESAKPKASAQQGEWCDTQADCRRGLTCVVNFCEKVQQTQSRQPATGALTASRPVAAQSALVTIRGSLTMVVAPGPLIGSGTRVEDGTVVSRGTSALAIQHNGQMLTIDMEDAKTEGLIRNGMLDLSGKFRVVGRVKHSKLIATEIIREE